MLMLNSMLENTPVISLRNGQLLGETSGIIINPANLKIEVLRCSITNSKQELFLLNQDIRDLSDNKVLINDYEVLSEASELIRLKDLIDLDFKIIGKPVVTKNKQKLGRVKEFSVESIGFYIKKLYVNPPLYKNIYGNQLVVDRNQILEVTDSKIIIKDLLQPTKVNTAIVAGSVSSAV
ncbi:MAG TPA: hypothetical protein VMV24_02325 [Candidatus Dormibacteraeota bacterium]|nr:hypothetical protein [Candidatus Dormibacteraeota bacterium]